MKQGLTVSALLLAFAALAPTARSQDVSTKGQITIGVHEVELSAGKLYSITVTGKGFRPQVSMRPGFLPFASGNQNNQNQYSTTYLAPKSEKATFLVLPDLFGLNGKGPFEYEFEVKGLTLSAKPALSFKGALEANDPPFKADFANRQHHRGFQFKMKAGETYVIDMTSPGGFGGLDSYLYLLDGNGKVVRSDDDGGGFPNARIVFTPPADGEYRIIATGLGSALGAFELTVRVPEKK